MFWTCKVAILVWQKTLNKSLSETKILSFNKVFNSLSLCVVLQTILDVFIYIYSLKIWIYKIWKILSIFQIFIYWNTAQYCEKIFAKIICTVLFILYSYIQSYCTMLNIKDKSQIKIWKHTTNTTEMTQAER